MATANMNLEKPTVGGSSGVWGTLLNLNADRLDVHDHSSGKGVRIPAGGLNLTTDLTLNGTAALTNVKAVGFTSQASYTTNKSLFVLSSDNELYWRNNAGTNVKITSGGTLNLSLVGGIGGDYAAASALVYYDDAAQAYRFLEAAPMPNSWSRVLCGDLDLYEHTSGATNRVRLSSPSALAASYALTFPGALPGSTLLWQVSSAGVITFSNTLGSGATVPAGQTLAVAGVVDFSAATSLRLPARKLLLDVAFGHSVGANADYNGQDISFSGPETFDIPIPLHAGDRITEISIVYRRDSGATILLALFSRTDGVSTEVVGKDVAAGAGRLTQALSSSPTRGALPVTLTDATATTYFFRMTGDTLDNLETVKVTYDHPT